MAYFTTAGIYATAWMHPIHTVAIIFLLALSFYQLLHPLRRYPGPLAAKFTNGYGAFYALKRSLHLQTLEDHKRYGPVVRQGPNKLVFNTTTAFKQIYQNERLTKPVSYLANQAKRGSHNTWNSLDRAMHRQKRKMMAPAVNDRSMKTFEPIVNEQINIFLKKVASFGRDVPVDMKDCCNYLGMDIVGLLSFGYPLHCQTEQKHRFLADHMPVSNRRLNAYMQIPFIPRYRIQVIINMIWHKSKERAYSLIEHMVKNRMQQPQDASHDFYSFVADSLKTAEGKSLRVNDLWMEAILFIVAGGDTTSTAMAATFFYLAHHPGCYEKLANEIRCSFQSGSEISSSKLAGCRYLRACIDESLRMSPPIPGTLWREQASDDTDTSPLVIDGHSIPPGTYVGVNTYAIQHNENYFIEPFKYKPERWLDSEGANGSVPEPLAAFSTGSRGCPGRAMAYMELSLLIAKSLWYFDFKSSKGDLGRVGFDRSGEFRIYDVYISTHDGPWLSFTPRETFSEDFPHSW
ncbi:cytochrome P450 [Xylariaceae sp. AK1471]|nr:cytochrome P450 [Xylariaceae sp. AK1471]